MLIPLIFFEWGYVFVAFFFVVILETFIVRLVIKEKFNRLLIILLKANLITTLLGYILQGLARLIIGAILVRFFELKPNVRGIFSIEYGDSGSSTIIQIVISIIITFIISVLVERRIMIKSLKQRFETRLVGRSIIIANIISYTVLLIWILSKFTTK